MTATHDADRAIGPLVSIGPAAIGFAPRIDGVIGVAAHGAAAIRNLSELHEQETQRMRAGVTINTSVEIAPEFLNWIESHIVRSASALLGEEIMHGVQSGIRRPRWAPTIAELRRWHAAARRTRRTPNLAYFGARCRAARACKAIATTRSAPLCFNGRLVSVSLVTRSGAL